jgi:hypothetical protein
MLVAIMDDGRKIQMYFNIEHAAQKMFDGKSAEEFLKQNKKN